MEYRVSENIDVNVNDDVLSFLGKNSNVILSEISNSDRVMMICLLKQYLDIAKALLLMWR